MWLKGYGLISYYVVGGKHVVNIILSFLALFNMLLKFNSWGEHGLSQQVLLPGAIWNSQLFY